MELYNIISTSILGIFKRKIIIMLTDYTVCLDYIIKDIQDGIGIYQKIALKI